MSRMKAWFNIFSFLVAATIVLTGVVFGVSWLMSHGFFKTATAIITISVLSLLTTIVERSSA